MFYGGVTQFANCPQSVPVIVYVSVNTRGIAHDIRNIYYLSILLRILHNAHQLARIRVQRRGSESFWPVRRLIHRPQTKTGPIWSRRQTLK